MFLWMLYTEGAPVITSPKPPNATITSNAPQTEIAAANAASIVAQTQRAEAASTLQESETRMTKTASTELAKAATQTQASNSFGTFIADKERRAKAAHTKSAAATSAALETMFPPAPPARINPNSMIWEIKDWCNDGADIWYRFFTTDRQSWWPDARNAWRTVGLGTPVAIPISCTAGQWVCFGAEAGAKSWGLGLRAENGCETCCELCNGTTYPATLTCQ